MKIYYKSYIVNMFYLIEYLHLLIAISTVPIYINNILTTGVRCSRCLALQTCWKVAVWRPAARFTDAWTT